MTLNEDAYTNPLHIHILFLFLSKNVNLFNCEIHEKSHTRLVLSCLYILLEFNLIVLVHRVSSISSFHAAVLLQGNLYLLMSLLQTLILSFLPSSLVLHASLITRSSLSNFSIPSNIQYSIIKSPLPYCQCSQAQILHPLFITIPS